MKQGSRRISYIGSIVWLMGFGLLAAACISIAMSLPIPSVDASGVIAWVQQHQTLLQVADEILACGASILLAIVVVLYGKFRERHPVGVSFRRYRDNWRILRDDGTRPSRLSGKWITDCCRDKCAIREPTVCGVALDGTGISCMCYCGSNYYEISADHPNERVCCTTKGRRHILCG